MTGSPDALEPAAPGWVPRGLLVAVGSFLFGGLTFMAQGWLPDEAVSLANSASGWTLLTVLLVAASRVPARVGGWLGAVSFVLLVLGYTTMAAIRGLTYDPLLFGVVGVVAGPFVGVATSWLRTTDLRAAAGTALLSGIGIGESVYGLTVVHTTTSPVYWVVIGLLGLALLVGMLIRLPGNARQVALAVAATAVVAGGFVVAYWALGQVGLGLV